MNLSTVFLETNRSASAWLRWDRREVWVLAFVLRLTPLVLGGGLTAILEEDDGVYFGASIRVIRGQLPYRDFIFVHPPGIIYLLTPFAALARITSEPFGLLLARIFVAAIGATTCLMIAVVVDRHAPGIGRFAGLFYAVCSGAIGAERTVMLEPVIFFSMVAALLLLPGGPRARALAAGLLAFGCVTKIWLVPLVAVFAAWVFVQHGWRSALRWGGMVVGAGVLLLLPVLFTGPFTFFDEVVRLQAGRARVWDGWQARLTYLDWVGIPAPLPRVLGPLGFTIFALVLIGLALGAVRAGSVGRVVTALLVCTVVLVFAAPAFFYHYGAFVAAPEAVALGLSVGRFQARKEHPVAYLRSFAVIALLVALLGVREVSRESRPPVAALKSGLAGEDCVWVSSASLAAALDVEASSCAAVLDGLATVLQESGGTGRVDQFTRSAAFQLRARSDFGRAAVAVLSPSDLATWDASTRADFLAIFPNVQQVANFQIRCRP